MRVIYPLLAVFMLLTGGCSVIGSIFEAGIWAGIIFVIIILVVIFIIVRLIRKARK